jgi:diaminopimelate decarboxylase
LKLLTARGAGLDIVSGGELYRAAKIRCAPKRIVYTSVGKTDREIAEAIRYGILMFNVESHPELVRIDKIAAKLKKKVTVALRFNPDIKPRTHDYITTGRKENKFGMDEALLKRIFSQSRNYPHLAIVGIHVHIGSQITGSAPFLSTLRKVNRIIRELKRKKVELKYLNIGGGLGIVYDKEKPQTAREFAGKISPLLRRSGLKIILEPGRFIAGNAGILAAKVIYLKESAGKNFIIVDAAMNDLIRPSLYGAYHKIVPLTKRGAAGKGKTADIVGPICESGDFLGKGRRVDVAPGDYIAVLGAGAYGFTMSSNYNSRPRPAEVLVKDGRAYLIRKREDYRDLVKGEIIV